MLGNTGVAWGDAVDLARLPIGARRFRLRSRIVDAAVRDIAEQGYDRVTEAAIVERAGVAVEVFQDLFPAGRDAVLLWAYDAAAAYVVPQVVRALRAAPDWERGVAAAVATYLLVLDCDRAWALACLRDVPRLGAPAAALRDERRRAVVDELSARPRLPRAGGVTAEYLLSAIDAVALDGMTHEPDRPLLARRHELAALALAPFSEAPAPRDARAVTPRPPLGSGDVRALVARGASGAAELDQLIRAAAVRRDGATLWRVATELGARRDAGVASRGEAALERRALAALDDAWFFGIGLDRDPGAGGTGPLAVMRYVVAHPGATEGDVRAGLGAEDRASVARTLASLEAEGLLRRTASASGPVRWWSSVIDQ